MIWPIWLLEMKSATLFPVPNIAANIGISFESTRTKINLFTLLMFFKAILKGLLLIEFDADGKKKLSAVPRYRTWYQENKRNLHLKASFSLQFHLVQLATIHHEIVQH